MDKRLEDLTLRIGETLATLGEREDLTNDQRSLMRGNWCMHTYIDLIVRRRYILRYIDI